MTLTAQQTFDTVVTHLFTQKRKAATSRTYADSEDGKTKTYLSCKYRTPEGLKCAAGCLIKDEFYDEWFEGEARHRL